MCNKQSRARYQSRIEDKVVQTRLNTERVRRYRAGIAAHSLPDGLEGEYGPVPEFVPEREWFDHVAVDRAVSGVRPVGRRLTPLEGAEVTRIRSEKETRTKDLTWVAISG